MHNWSEERIQETLHVWQPKYDAIGVKLTEADAREILDNLTGFFEILMEWDLKQRKRVQEIKQQGIPERLSVEKSASKKLVSVNELAKILNVPASWIYARTRQGEKAIPYIKIGKYLRFDPDEVVAFFKNKR